MRREQLTTTQRGVDALSGERVEEIRGVSDQRGARRPGSTRGGGKRTRRPNRSDSLGAHKPLGQVRAGLDPLLEEGSLVFTDLLSARHRYDYRDVHQAIADIHYAEIPVVVDVHLAHVGHPLNLPVVRDEGDAPWPDATGSDEAESSADHGAKAVGTDHEPGIERARRAVRSDYAHAADPRRSIAGKVGDMHPFLDARAGVARATQHDLVENGPANSQTFVAKSTESVIGREFSAGDHSIGRAAAHSGQMRRTAALDLVENAHIGQNSRRLWAQILGADLVARKSGAIEHQNVDTLLRQRPGGGGAGRPATDDDYFRV